MDQDRALERYEVRPLQVLGFHKGRPVLSLESYVVRIGESLSSDGTEIALLRMNAEVLSSLCNHEMYRPGALKDALAWAYMGKLPRPDPRDIESVKATRDGNTVVLRVEILRGHVLAASRCPEGLRVPPYLLNLFQSLEE